ncbi:MAG: hypothetical protein ABI877_16915 [Gemmatimonadaceae bacterium]
MIIAPLAFLLAVTTPLQMHLAICPKWDVVRTDSVWPYLNSAVVAHTMAVGVSGKRLIALAGRDHGWTAAARNSISGIVFEENGRRLHKLTKPPGDFTFDMWSSRCGTVNGCENARFPFAMTFCGRANLIVASYGVPRILLSTTPWTSAGKTTKAPLYWQLFTMR